MVRASSLIGAVFFTALLASAGLAFPGAAFAQGKAESRVALVIGNANYAVSPLVNPTNDATDVARRLEELGFKVILRLNAGQREMKRSVREFSAALRDHGDVGLFYYAGHGIQSKGRNYLIPVSADIRNEYELEDESVDANLVLSALADAQVRVSIVILDACRNNPYAKAFRSAGSGLAQMETAVGTLIAFATAPGATAEDGVGRNGVYTKHLLASLREPDGEVERVFKRVAQGVAKETAGRQIPWVSSSLTGDFSFALATAKKASPKPPVDDRSMIQTVQLKPILQIDVEMEHTFWKSIESSKNAEEYEAYLEKYPEGRFAGLAKARIRSLRAK